MDIKQKFGNIIRDIRKNKNISQEEFANLAKLHRTYISDVERGKKNISIENIEKLANALDVSVSSLFL